MAFNILLNRDSAKHRRTEAQSIAENTGLDLGSAEALRTALYERHKAIKHRFNTGFGLNLQRIDSDIALAAIKHYTSRNIPVITVHDSVVVSYKYAPDVELYLYECYQRVINKFISDKTMTVDNAETGTTEQVRYYTSGGGIEVDDSGLNETERSTMIDAYERHHHQ